jgi:hypothetical protein
VCHQVTGRYIRLRVLSLPLPHRNHIDIVEGALDSVLCQIVDVRYLSQCEPPPPPPVATAEGEAGDRSEAHWAKPPRPSR